MHYTPPQLAPRLAELALAAFFEEPHAERPWILDPACGDGALLRAVLDVWPLSCPVHSIGRLCGADIDADSLEQVRRRWPAEADPPRLACGNALTGDGWGVGESCTAESVAWGREFPEAAAAGGFDVVIGNPPYHRERDAKALFDELAATPLGQRWRGPRMDLWQYFVHRGLDLLRPGGVLAYLLPSYWTASRQARVLRERLAAETTPWAIALLGAAPLFRGVSGRHLLLVLRKRPPTPDDVCRIIDVVGTTAAERDAPEFWDRALRFCRDPVVASGDPRLRAVRCCEMFEEQGLVLDDSPRVVHAPAARLGDWYDVRQGIAENPPVVTPRLLLRWPGDYAAGDGVFVLTAAEVARLELSAHEAALLRPYYAPADFARYRAPESPSRWLLYLTRDTAPDESAIPRIIEHLARFRSLLEARRETRRGVNRWWHLHWPREPRLFEDPRIVCVQMARRPTFVYMEVPGCVGFSVNVIQARVEDAPSLPVLTGLLNSAHAAAWFQRHAKHRGVSLEINGGHLREFPLPPRRPELELRLAGLVRQRQAAAAGGGNGPAADQVIDEVVAAWYGEHGSAC